MLMKPEAIYHIMADSLRLVLAFLHIKIENNYKQVPYGAENRMALVIYIVYSEKIS